MKTPQECLKEAWSMTGTVSQVTYNEVFQNEVIPRAMRLYSDQQNKELRERADELATELHETMIKHDQLFDEAERLTKQNDEYKNVMTTLTQMIESKNATIKELQTFLKEAYATT